MALTGYLRAWTVVEPFGRHRLTVLGILEILLHVRTLLQSSPQTGSCDTAVHLIYFYLVIGPASSVAP